jgi:hypothetical protein
MKIMEAYYNSRDTPLDAVSLFELKYPTTKRERRAVGARHASKEPEIVYESPVHEPDFCWALDRAALRSAMSTASQTAFAVAAADKILPKTKKCGGQCGASYPKGQYLVGTVKRITTLWGKGEWKKPDGVGLCALCKSDALMAQWRIFTNQDSPVKGVGKDNGTPPTNTVDAAAKNGGRPEQVLVPFPPPPNQPPPPLSLPILWSRFQKPFAHPPSYVPSFL